MRASPPVSLLGAPTDIGAGDRGAVMGPEALRIAGLAEALGERGLVRNRSVAPPPAPDGTIRIVEIVGPVRFFV